MAGVVPFPGNTPGRKQWIIKDKKSSRKIRSELAEDGCPESQVVLAKQLLREKNFISINDNEENAKLGVFWLIKASEQGNLEATNILRQCLETGEGITEYNYETVKACLSTPQNEKLAKRAAKEMFMSLSDGQDFITSKQLRKQMRKIYFNDLASTSTSKEGNQNFENDILENEKEEDLNVKEEVNIKDEINDEDFMDGEEILGCVEKNEKFDEKLTESHLKNAAFHYSKGELPLVEGVFALTEYNNKNIDNLNCLQRTFLYPFIRVQRAHLKLLNNFSLRYRTNYFSVFSTSVSLQFLILFLLYPLLTIENLVLFLPMCIYYISFFYMVVSTLQMLQSQKEYTDFRVWSRLFLRYDRDGNLNTDDPEFEFCKKNMRPYGLFFFSLLINLVVYPFISELWIPQSELATISFAFTFLTLYIFHGKSAKKIDYLLLFSFALYVLAKYPYETDGVVRQTWRFLDIELPTLQDYGFSCFVSQIVGTGVEFCLNFRGFFYLLIPGIFFKIASRDNWRGIYKLLIPHCVTLSWWQIAVISCQGATWYGLLRSTLALVGLIFFLPLAGIATVLLPVVAFVKHFAYSAWSSRHGIAVTAIIITFVIYVYKRQLGLRSGFIKAQILIAVISSGLLLSSPLNDFFDESITTDIQPQPTLSWDQYSSVCQKSSWDKRMDAVIQNDCIGLNGLKIHWYGIVDNVRIIKVQNNFLKLLNLVPEPFKNKIKCYYGESYESNCSNDMKNDENKEKLCTILNKINTKEKCHLNSWNRYDLEITVKINSDKWNSVESKIKLIVDDSMKNYTFKLEGNDHIWFRGILNNPETIGTENLSITVDEIGCINCSNKNLKTIKKLSDKLTGKNFPKEIYNGFKRILNFVFNPVINIR